jgi:exosortase
MAGMGMKFYRIEKLLIKGDNIHRSRNTRRFVLFLFFVAATVVFFHAPLKRLMDFAFGYNELYSHIILIPLVSCYLIYLKKREIFADSSYSYASGTVLTIMAVPFYLVGRFDGGDLAEDTYLSLMTLSAVLCWLGGFVLIYGPKAARKAAFPLLFLLFMIPLPEAVAEGIISVLQMGSANVANGFFALTGVPYFREGFTFHLSSLSIEVAPQCSGIRSTLALFITSVLAGHLFLRTGWKKAALSLSIFPITIFKNGLRIVTLTLLGAYVDPRILSSSLHRKGGIPFFILALAIFMPILWYLRKTEKSKPLRSESD